MTDDPDELCDPPPVIRWSRSTKENTSLPLPPDPSSQGKAKPFGNLKDTSIICSFNSKDTAEFSFS